MFALYIHWPFCKSKCPYCDFNSHLFDKIDYKKWEHAYLSELDHFRDILEANVITSIFFGGGTPSLMPPYIVESILKYIDTHFKTSPNIEITLEANPTSVETSTFGDLYHAGINRFSIGIQSFNQKDLIFLGREHSINEAKEALEKAAEITPNYSFDLIYNRPNQTIESWTEELNEALTYASKHLSLYQLTIEKGTPFYKAYKDKEFLLPDEETAADLYEVTQDIMSTNQMPSYEISNHARKGYECIHNLNYWQYNEYLGIGPGAHSRVTIDKNLSAMIMTHNPGMWLKNINDKKQAIQQLTTLSYEEILEEFFMMGLRLNAGISLEKCQNLLRKPIHEVLNPNILNNLIDQELLILDKTHLKATHKGLPILNHLLGKLLAN